MHRREEKRYRHEKSLEVKLRSEEQDPVENYRLDIPIIEAIEVRQCYDDVASDL